MKLIASIKKHFEAFSVEKQLKDNELKTHLVELRKKKLMLPITLYQL